MVECELQYNEIVEKLDTILDLISDLKPGNGKKRVKRKASKYNIFIGTCMKEGKNMKQCAVEYKAGGNV